MTDRAPRPAGIPGTGPESRQPVPTPVTPRGWRRGGMRLSALILAIACGGLMQAGVTYAKGIPAEVVVQPNKPVPKLPPGTGRNLIQTRCTVCHATDLIVQQRLTPAQWGTTVAKMVRWGAHLNSDEAAVATAYLTERFSVLAPRARMPLSKVRTGNDGDDD